MVFRGEEMGGAIDLSGVEGMSAVQKLVDRIYNQLMDSAVLMGSPIRRNMEADEQVEQPGVDGTEGSTVAPEAVVEATEASEPLELEGKKVSYETSGGMKEYGEVLDCHGDKCMVAIGDSVARPVVIVPREKLELVS